MSFALDIARLVDKYKGNIDRAVRVTGMELTRRIVLNTPVDSGRLRGNWQVTVNTPASGTIDRTDKGGSGTIQAAMAAIRQAPGNVLWISNNLPYAQRIEYEGWSKVKAPAGMVRVSIVEVQDRFDRLSRSAAR